MPYGPFEEPEISKSMERKAKLVRRLSYFFQNTLLNLITWKFVSLAQMNQQSTGNAHPIIEPQSTSIVPMTPVPSHPPQALSLATMKEELFVPNRRSMEEWPLPS